MATKKNKLKDMDVAEMKKNVLSLQEEIRSIRFKAEGAKSKNVKETLNLRKQIARMLTEMNKNNNK